MPIEVELPDGTIVEFPDGTDDATMERALSQYAQAPEPEAPLSIEERYARAGLSREEFDPTEGNSFLQNAMIGVGKSIYDTGRGLQQLVGQRSQEQVMRDRELDAPLMQTSGGVVGNILGQAAQIAAPVPGGLTARVASSLGRAAPYAGAAARAGAFGAAQGVGDGESRANNATTSAALGAVGQGVAGGVGRLAAGAKKSLTPAVQQSIEMARRAGIPLHLSQVTESRFLKGVGSVVNNLPFSGAGKAQRSQQEAFNKAVGRSFGSEAATLSDDVIGAAKKRIGSVYEDIYSRNSVKLDDEALGVLADLEVTASRNLTPDAARVIKNQIDDILEAAKDGAMPGRKYQAFRTDRLLPMEAGDRSFQSQMVREVRRALDEAADRSVSPADAEALAIARRQYRNLKTTEKALNQVSGAGGNVRPAALWPIVNQSRGATPEMRELAKIGQNVLKDPIPNSGTPERQMIMGLLGLSGAGALGGGMPAIGGVAAAGALGGRLMNSPLAAAALGQGRPLAGVARLVKPAPRLLPAAGPAAGIEIDVSGGRVGTAAEIAEQEEWLRRYKARRGQ